MDELIAAVKVKAGDKVLCKQPRSDYFLAVVTKTTKDFIYVQSLAGDKFKYSANTKMILGKAKGTKKTEVKEADVNKYLVPTVVKSKVPEGLLGWVEDYKKLRHFGNIKDAKFIKEKIDAQIKKLNLSPKDVYGEYKDTTYTKVETKFKIQVSYANGVSKIKEMKEQNLLDKYSDVFDIAETKDLSLFIYLYDASVLIGFAYLRFDGTSKYQLANNIMGLGNIGVNVDSKYRGQGLAKLLLLKLREKCLTTKFVTTNLKKYKLNSPKFDINFAKRITPLVKPIFTPDKFISLYW